MATGAQALTETSIENQIHTAYEGNTSYPASTDDDYLARRNLLNEAIMRWDMYNGTLWNELWTSSSNGDGDQTISSSKTQYNAPSDFRFMAGYLRLYDSVNLTYDYYTKIKPEDSDKYNGRTARVFYITGNARSGYKINFLPGSGSDTFPKTSDVGKTIIYEYYKRPNLFANTTDIPELSNPDYLVHYTLAYLYRQDDNFDAYDREMAIAMDILKQMQTINTMASWRENDHIKDGLFDDNDFSGFGM